jgi:GDP-4-dehydro-6-deoxy-D-mannose reductase
MRVLVTGLGGFAGSHLADWLLECGDTVIGLIRGPELPPAAAHLTGRVSLCHADLNDEAAVREVVLATAPDIVYHLAAQASPAAAHREPVRLLVDNVTGAATVLHAALACPQPPRVLLVTSSDMYGLPPSAEPLGEDTPPNPPNAYAVSKVCAHHLGRQLWQTHGLAVIEARPFNHIGPRQRLGFVAPDFASQLAAIEQGRAEPVLRVGDLRAGRDFCDVRDVVRGYRALALDGEPGTAYHLCSERAVTIAELVERLVGLTRVAVRVEVDAARLRPGVPSVVVGSARRVREAFGWRAEIALERSLGDVLEEWRRLTRVRPT